MNQTENTSGAEITDIPHFMCGKAPVDPERSVFAEPGASTLDEIQSWNLQNAELLEQLEDEMPAFVVSEHLLARSSVRQLNLSAKPLALRKVRNTTIPRLVIQNS